MVVVWLCCLLLLCLVVFVVCLLALGVGLLYYCLLFCLGSCLRGVMVFSLVGLCDIYCLHWLFVFCWRQVGYVGCVYFIQLSVVFGCLLG